jgi:hypothetical protein
MVPTAFDSQPVSWLNTNNESRADEEIKIRKGG